MIPASPRDLFMKFCSSHSPIWTAEGPSIGLSAPTTAAYAAALTAAQDAIAAQAAAQNAAKSATELANARVKELRNLTTAAVTTIRVFAEGSADPAAVYAAADIPGPSTPQPVPQPGTPFDLAVRIDPTTGELILSWKCKNPKGASGTSYIVKRRLPNEAPFTFLGVTGTKEFRDTTLFAGPDTVQYTVQATRSGLSGNISPILVVNFGRTTEGGFTATAQAA